ncbi:nucleic-acid-binding protein from transposon x-element [Lasius niger]|uniref:Nucleic-acid-binding protein from transposon x-element n=1 Tax=Lasius niger TaxID=67767 RepID=A0A0J7K2T8_LASNI|nr:nucleic-acid-binding protein from transposon x-element [Lasius niger]
MSSLFSRTNQEEDRNYVIGSISNFEPQTQNENLLWMAWKQAESKIRQLEEKIRLLQPNEEPRRVTYETDEEELERETEWEMQKRNNRKKRKANSSPEISSGLTKMANEKDTEMKMTEKKGLPSPIFASGIKNFNQFKEMIISKVENNICFKMMANGEVKINTTESDDYRAIIQLLKTIKIQINQFHDIAYHTYQCKQAKPYKVIIKGLHPSTNIEDIRNELAKLGHEATRISNIIIKKKVNMIQTKTALFLFYIDLTPSLNNKDIYDMEDLLYCKIKVEPPKIRKEIPQCKRCQNYEHTQNYLETSSKYTTEIY